MAATLQLTIFAGGTDLTAYLTRISGDVPNVDGYALTHASDVYTASIARAGRYVVRCRKVVDGPNYFLGYVDLVDGAICEPVDTLAELDVEQVSEAAIIDGVIDGLDSVTITRVGPAFDPAISKFTLIHGDDYVVNNAGHTDFDIGFTGVTTGWTAIVGAKSQCGESFLGRGSFVNVSGVIKLRVEWPKELQTTPPGEYRWQAKVIDPDGLVRTKIDGRLVLQASTIDGE